jgi:HAD superfamily hydrolase (TIGR01509 family)
MRTPTDVDAVVFDCDGLLAETEAGWTRAETAIFREHGHDFGPEQKRLLIGGTLASGGEAMADYFGLPGAGPALADRLAGLVWQELAAGAPALPGARDMADALRHRGVPIAVASNSPRRFVEAALSSAGLMDLFEVIVSSDDVENAKPAPDLYLTACTRLAAQPERSVAFEDSRTGVAAARAAKMFVVGVPSMPDATADAHVTYHSLAHPELRSWMSSCTAPRPMTIADGIPSIGSQNGSLRANFRLCDWALPIRVKLGRVAVGRFRQRHLYAGGRVAI